MSLSWILAAVHDKCGCVYRCVWGSHDRTQNASSVFDPRTVTPTVQKRALHVDECEETITDCNGPFVVIRASHCQGNFLWTTGMSRSWYEWRLQKLSVMSCHKLMLRMSHVRLLKRCASIAIKFLFAIPSLNFLHVKQVKQSRYRPGVAQRIQEVKVPRFHDTGPGWW